MVHFVGRNTETDWLTRSSRLFRVLAIQGPMGIGKSSLTYHWLKSTRIPYQVIAVQRFKTLRQILDGSSVDESSSDETALGNFFERERNAGSERAMVWENVHLLSEKSRALLFGFLANTPDLPLQILISDSDLGLSPSMNDLFRIPVLNLGPLNSGEIQNLLDDLNLTGETAPSYGRTGGIPLLLALWAQNRTSGTDSEFDDLFISSFSDLTDSERKILSLLAMADCPLTAKILAACLSVSTQSIDDTFAGLVKKLFILKHDTTVTIIPYLRGPFLEVGKKLVTKEMVQKLLKADLSLSPYERARLECEYVDSQNGILTLTEQSVDSMDSLASEAISNILELIQTHPPKSPHSRLERLLIKGAFIASERGLALAQARKTLARLSALPPLEPLSSENQALIVEIIQLYVRQQEHLGAENLIQRFRDRLREPFKTLALIEEVVPKIESDPLASERKLRLLSKRIETNQDDGAHQGTLPILMFQLGRALQFQGRLSEAKEAYRDAFERFTKIGKPYFASVSALNHLWLVLSLDDETEVDRYLSQLRVSALRFGYRYVSAGVEVIQARINRLHLRFGQSLESADRALRLLGEAAPLTAFADAVSEMCLTLFEMGLRNRAIEFLNKNFKKSPRFDLLRLQLDTPNLLIDSWLDSWETLNPPENWNHIRTATCLERGYDETLEPSHGHSLRDKILVAQYELIRCLAHTPGDLENTWQAIAKLESVLSKVSEPAPEKVALALTQCLLADAGSEQKALLIRAELEYQRLSSDAEVKAPLEAWLEATRGKLNGKNAGAPSQSSVWKRSPQGDQERWRKWWQPFWTENTRTWIHVSLNGRRELKHEPDYSKWKDLIIHEELGDLMLNTRKLEGFDRSHSLRRLLILLLDSYPRCVSKSEITSELWQESYNPQIHDGRIYTNIQRVKDLLSQVKSKKLSDCIQSRDQGYRWNPKTPFHLIRSTDVKTSQSNRLQGLILRTMESVAQSGNPWISRSQILNRIGEETSEASLKRELSKLVSRAWLTRKGAGRAVQYSRIGSKM